MAPWSRSKDSKSEFAVIGLGRFGQAVALTLIERGYLVLGIDREREVVQELSDQITQTAILDATDEDALRDVDIAVYDTVVVAIGTDFSSAMLTTLALKSLGVKRVVCMATNERQRTILQKIGADQVVMPVYESGRQLAKTLTSPAWIGQLDLSKEYSIAEVAAPASFVGRTLREVDVHAAFGVTLLSIKRGEELILSLPVDLRFEKGDLLVLFGKDLDINRITEAP